MTNIDSLLNLIKEDLNNEQCVKDYFYYKNIIENDKELKKIDEQMRFHQKEMCKNKNNSAVSNDELLKYEELKRRIDENPILVNFEVAKEEVNSLLLQIKDILN